MFISRMTLSPDMSGKRTYQGEYALHKAVWEFFKDRPDQERDFLYRRDVQRGSIIILTVSMRQPRPDGPHWTVATKPYTPDLRHGDRLRFSLRANPTRTKYAGSDTRGKRVDVIMDHKKRLKAENVPPDSRPTESAMAQRLGCDWLLRRAAGIGLAIEEDTLLAHSYTLWRFAKPATRNPLQFATLDFEGFATVADPAKALDAMTRGVGPAKGFGCGLLLARRA
ncbi:type I-E CRISPR-associated protein Cas6/Cse3/CasE [Desulfolutivibrio sulfoxidireducens]|uniref:type I-E CRISPR-associated protein Cas6/Cse3/CasE n=1 Tax=Desulfolutivibrio sulfoxidireducens TaxID=2773299 RepID=UPI00159D8477|nr:type I-E CRISPR-associated protein Cas6/Cse3/CasE [Desulfolutivibrio sulfoxidireducens]QLA20891.1 type I-E CRISPR-associated protein Cas6/Cse3/CasE [Desulfolutivibrio sulfoxidireducens]